VPGCEGDTRVCGASRRGATSRVAAHVDARARARRVRATTREVDDAKPRARDDALERADARRDDDDDDGDAKREDVDGDDDERAVDDRSIRWDHRR